MMQARFERVFSDTAKAFDDPLLNVRRILKFEDIKEEEEEEHEPVIKEEEEYHFDCHCWNCTWDEEDDHLRLGQVFNF